MSTTPTTTTTTTTRDRGDRYGPMEWAQLSKLVIVVFFTDQKLLLCVCVGCIALWIRHCMVGMALFAEFSLT